jgi:flagellin
MTVINTNIASLKARLYGLTAQSGQELSMQRLSSGRRINSSSDDAAGSAVAMKLDAQLQGQKAAIKTATDAIALLKTQEAGVKQFVNIIHRIKEIAIQMANGTYSDADRALAQSEVDQLTAQFTMAAAGTQFNSKAILNGNAAATYTIQAGANASESFTIDVIEGATLATTLSANSDVTSQANAILTADASPAILQTTMENLATIGASINRLLTTINNLSNSSNNTEKALGRISDADFANETAKLTKEQLLVQVSNQMLSNANKSKSILVQLLE